MIISSLKILRTGNNLTQKQVAKLLDIPVYKYQLYEYGKEIIPEAYLKILANRYGVIIERNKHECDN